MRKLRSAVGGGLRQDGATGRFTDVQRFTRDAGQADVMAMVVLVRELQGSGLFPSGSLPADP